MPCHPLTLVTAWILICHSLVDAACVASEDCDNPCRCPTPCMCDLQTLICTNKRSCAIDSITTASKPSSQLNLLAPGCVTVAAVGIFMGALLVHTKKKQPDSSLGGRHCCFCKKDSTVDDEDDEDGPDASTGSVDGYDDDDFSWVSGITGLLPHVCSVSDDEESESEKAARSQHQRMLRRLNPDYGKAPNKNKGTAASGYRWKKKWREQRERSKQKRKVKHQQRLEARRAREEELGRRQNPEGEPSASTTAPPGQDAPSRPVSTVQSVMSLSKRRLSTDIDSGKDSSGSLTDTTKKAA